MLTIQYTYLNTRYKLRRSTSYVLHNSNRNEVIKQQSLNFGKNQPEQTTESYLQRCITLQRTILYNLLTM